MGRVTIFVTPLGWADGHGPDAGQWPGSYGQCAASPWAALAERAGTWSQLRAAPARCAAAPWGGSGRVDGRAPGHSSGQSWRTARQAESGPNRRQRGRTHGRGRTAPARRAAAPWAVLAERMGGHLVQLRVVRRTARRATGGLGRGPLAGCRAMAGRLQGGALCLPGAALAERAGGPRSQLRAVRRTASGPPVGHWLNAWQRPGSSSAARCGSLGRPWPRG